MKNSLLIEIFAEYIPKQVIEQYLSHINTRFTNLFQTYDITAKTIKTFFTKCRIAICMDELKLASNEKERIVVGPPLKNSYNPDSSPTSNLLGFLKKWNKEVRDVIKPYAKDNKEYIAIKVNEDIFIKNTLIDNLDKILETGKFYKQMKWDQTQAFFARPIRNFLAIFCDKVLPVSVFKINAQDKTITNLINPKLIDIKSSSPNKYISIMKKYSINIDQDARKKEIIDQLEKVKKSFKFNENDLSLVEQWIYECDNPSLQMVEFDEKHLQLPKTFIEHILKNKLYLLPLYNNNELTNKAIFAINKVDRVENIIFWLKEVISAKLEDLKFYWQNDLSNNLETLREKLANIVFPKNIGSIKDKIERIEKILFDYQIFEKANANIVILENNKRIIKEIFQYYKIDCVTQTFTEYPELEGHILYELLKAKEINLSRQNFYENILQSYLPHSQADSLNGSIEPKIVSLIDKLDDVFSFYINGFKPKAQEDPFFIKKKTTLAIYILHTCDNLKTIPIKNFLNLLFEYYSDYYRNKIEPTFKEFFDYFVERYKNFLIEKGYKENIVNVVLKSQWNSFKDVKSKINAMEQMMGAPFWQQLFEIVNRTKRIINEQCKTFQFNQNLLQQEEEKLLFNIHKNFQTNWENRELDNPGSDFAKSFTINYYEPLHNFFEKVFVEVEDKNLQLNRKNLLYQIYRLFVEKIADISLLQT